MYIVGDETSNFLHGGNEDDVLDGASGDDTLAGGAGNDRLMGGSGNNTYVFQRGDGQDLILSYDPSPTKQNVIAFGEGVAPSDILVQRIDERLVLSIKGSADQITVEGFFQQPMHTWDGALARPMAIEEIRFIDGARWDRSAILTQLQLAVAPMVELDDQDNQMGGSSLDGRGGNDELFGFGDTSLLAGGSGDDVLWSGGASAILLGGSGSDKLTSGYGDDVLEGGQGNDLLDGGSGNNTYLFARGWGQDRIATTAPSWDLLDQAVQLADVLPGAVSLSRSDNGFGNDLIIAVKGGTDQITLADYFNPSMAHIRSATRIAFADHSVWTANQIDWAVFGPPGMTQEGGDGDDVLFGGWDNDLLLGGAGNDQLDGGPGNDVLVGGAGDDVLRGGDGDDTLDPGAGNASLDGGGGNNMVLFGRDAGEVFLMTYPAVYSMQTVVLDADVLPGDLSIALTSDYELSVGIKGTVARIAMPFFADLPTPDQPGVQFRFADGTIWDNAVLLRQLFTGDDGDNVLLGRNGADAMFGKGGRDTLAGSLGNDTLYGGSGDDFLDGGDGNDQLLGEDGNDQLLGGVGDDTLAGGAGDDAMFDPEGNNTYMFGRGDGHDVIYPAGYSIGGVDTIALGAGIAPAEIALRLQGGGGPRDLILSINGSSDELVVLQYAFYDDTAQRLQFIRFADGTTWDSAAIVQRALAGDEGDNQLAGLSGDDVIDGKGGNDILSGNAGNDTLFGGDGNDVLEGGAGINTLNGGAGIDMLHGGADADTYVFAPGDCFDMIRDDVGAGGNVVRFAAGISPLDVHLTLDESQLRIQYGEQAEVTVVDANMGAGTAQFVIDRFEFADNTVLGFEDLFNRAPVLANPIGPREAGEGQWFNLVVAAGTFTDSDAGDALTYELTQADGSALPGWLGFNGQSGDLWGNPGFTDSGMLNLKLTATDTCGRSASDQFALTINDVNRAPELAQPLPDQAAPAAQPFSFAIPAATFLDPDEGDGGSLSVLAADGTALPAWLGFDPDTRTLSGTPAAADTAILELMVISTDRAGAAVAAPLRLNVNVSAPLVANRLVDASTDEAQAFTMALPAATFSDADVGDQLALSVRLASGAALPSWLRYDAAAGTLSGTPDDADTGIYNLAFSATDTRGLTARDSFRLTVNNINQAPTVQWGSTDLATQEGWGFTMRTPQFADADRSDTLSVLLAMADGSALPSWMSFDAATGWLSGSIGYSSSGAYAIRASATDSGQLSVSSTFNIVIADVNRAPVLQQAIVAQTATEASLFSLPIPVATFVDPDGGAALAYRLTLADGAPLPAWLAFDAASMTLSGTAGDADTGLLQLRLTASDSAALASNTGFSLNVVNVNQAPVLSKPVASQSTEDAVPFSLVLPADMFGDADAGDSGALQVGPLPAWLGFAPQTRTFSGTPTYADVGSTALTVTWTDRGGLTAQAGFALAVTAAASVNLTGTDGADFLVGKSNGDTLSGGAGNDSLDGGTGADQLSGGTGNDTYIVDNAGDVVMEGAAAGIDLVLANIDYSLAVNVENLTLSGSGAINATGNALNNILTGNGGANVLNGASGGDIMDGGAGNDTYVIDNSADVVTESATGGLDRVISSIGKTLDANVEVLSLTGSAVVNGYGNAGNNLLTGNVAANILNGNGGVDILQGGGGNDTLSDASPASNLFDGGAGADRLSGGAGNEMFIGGAGADTIDTYGGADVIVFNRGDGLDTVTASSGSDNTVSLGHGIRYADLAFKKSGNDLLFSTGAGEQITFKGWYAGSNRSVATLQVVIERGADYAPDSASNINDNKVETFNFAALAAKFDQARAANGALVSWSLASSLAACSTGGSDSAAIGGDLAYQYALNGNLSSLAAVPALAIVGSPSFGIGSQALLGGAALADGTPLLY